MKTRILKHAAVPLLVVLHLSLPTGQAQCLTEKPGGPANTTQSQKYQHEGVIVEFVTAAKPGSARQGLMEGSDATIRFRVSDSNSGKPLNSLRPAAWVDRIDAGATSNERSCRE